MKKKYFYVPWPDVLEWNSVRDLILSSDIIHTVKAYEMISMWKLKYDNLPAYLESTFSLLQVLIKEHKMLENKNKSLTIFEEHDLQLAYSAALVRFVNHVSSVSGVKNETLYWAAKMQNIPDWIINIRHEAAHSQNLPSLDALHVAAELSLKWLIDHYWKDTDDKLKKNSEVLNVDESNVHAKTLFKKFFQIWDLCLDSKRTYFAEMNRDLINHLKELLHLKKFFFENIECDSCKYIHVMVKQYEKAEGGQLKISKTPKVKEFQKLFLQFLKRMAKQINNGQSFVMALIESSYLKDCDLKSLKWKKILHLVQNIKSFQYLLEELFEMAGNGCEGAKNWLIILLPSIKHLKKEWTLFQILMKENDSYEPKKFKKKIRLTNKENCHNLKIILDIRKPPVVNLKMMEKVLLNPETMPVSKIISYLKMVKPRLPRSTTEAFIKLLHIHQKRKKKGRNGSNEGKGKGEGESESGKSEKIFTVDDLETIMEEQVSLVNEEDEDEDGLEGWVLSKIDIQVWSKCPLGLLPFQTKVDCSLPQDLTWKSEKIVQKNLSLSLTNDFSHVIKEQMIQSF